ncbi:MAG: MBL fold metallo-hydrolase [Clostridiales bacterium]|nr:MBL fold metallo-hydrolase [Clostridiales bacterium]
MHIIIGGGIGEHGRNCLYIQGADGAFIVDCGLMASDANPYPRLSAEQIRRAKWLLLTHSHQDHAGAYPWLVQQGFDGVTVASEETFAQLPFEVSNRLAIAPEQTLALDGGLQVSCGRSGHCVGSLWFEVDFERKRLFFSGDYTEDTLLYACDKVRGRWADVAFLDCGRDIALGSAEALQHRILQVVSETVHAGRAVILPVPRFGRGLELMQLLHGIGHFRLDEDSQAARDSVALHPDWFKAPLKDASSPGGSIYFIADTQLKRPGNRVTAERLLHDEALILLTGHSDDNSFSLKLLRTDKALFIPYPTHASDRTVELLGELNSFPRIIRTHTDRHTSPGDFEI